jgi:hypothetical protein
MRNGLVKYLIPIVLIFSGLNTLAQNTMLECNLTKWTKNDTIIPVSYHYSDESYSPSGELRYELKKKHIDDTLSTDFKLFYFHELSDDRTIAWTRNGDTSSINYICDTLNSRKYVIEGLDTTIIYGLEFSNQRIIKETCLLGCNDTSYYHYNNFGKLDSLRTNYGSGNTDLCLWQHDSLGRITHYIMHDNNPNDNSHNYLSMKYLAKPKRVIQSSGHTDIPDYIDKSVTYLDENNLPIRKIITIISGENKTIFELDYTQK